MAVDNFVVISNQTSAVPLDTTDTLSISPVGSITTTGVDAVVWDLAGSTTAPGIVIYNQGLISSTVRGIDTTNSSGGAPQVHLINDGQIVSTDDAFRLDDGMTGGKIVVDNYGTIESKGSGQAIDFNKVGSASLLTITNWEHGLIQATDADAIRPGENALITNYGDIIAKGSGSTDAIDFQDTHGGGIIHNLDDGLIEGARHGITAKEPVTVYNEGTILGDLGGGLNIDADPGDESDLTIVTNHGTIRGTSGGSQDGDGIDIDALLSLDNYGLVEALGTATGATAEAITIGGGTINNYAGGLIHSVERAINVDDSSDGNALAATLIYNEGTIKGDNGEAIRIVDTFGDTITNLGAILGSVVTGGGEDTFNYHTGSTVSGLTDGGDDDDTLNLLGAGAGTLAQVANVEALHAEGGGVWTIADSQGYANGVTIATGTTLRVGAGGAAGALVADVAVEGLFSIDRSDAFVFAGEISGDGVFQQRGDGTTSLTHENSYSGGTWLSGGTLEIAVAGAAGTGAITFGAGAQTLVIGEGAFAVDGGVVNRIPGAAADAPLPAVFGNAIANFGRADSIDLAGLDFAAGAKATYNAQTGILTVSSKGTVAQLQFSGSHVKAFTAEADGSGGTQIVARDAGVVIRGSNHKDVVAAEHTVFGKNLPTAHDDVILGRGGNDRLAGLGGNDRINGGAGRDVVSGGKGDDVISGGTNMNRLTGDAGHDAFVFNTWLGQGKGGGAHSSFSLITDFKPGVDLILLDHRIFKSLTPGVLSESEFHAGATAGDGDDHILVKNGRIYYDQDGAGGHDPVLFAEVNKAVELHASDFLVI